MEQNITFQQQVLARKRERKRERERERERERKIPSAQRRATNWRKMENLWRDTNFSARRPLALHVLSYGVEQLRIAVF
jgi:hypothetical protein